LPDLLQVEEDFRLALQVVVAQAAVLPGQLQRLVALAEFDRIVCFHGRNS
jgi:hypothetical protein